MDDRDYIASGALAVLDALARCQDSAIPARSTDFDRKCTLPHLMACDAWMKAGRPLLTARARAVLEAVEEYMADCGGCAVSRECAEGEAEPGVAACARNLLMDIRRAYLGDPALANPPREPSGAPHPIIDGATGKRLDGTCVTCLYDGACSVQRGYTTVEGVAPAGCWTSWEAKPTPVRTVHPSDLVAPACMECGENTKDPCDGCTPEPAELKPAPCATCGGTGRVPCQHDGPSDTDEHDCMDERPMPSPCPEGHLFDLHGPCTIPCPTCGAKEQGR